MFISFRSISIIGLLDHISRIFFKNPHTHFAWWLTVVLSHQHWTRFPLSSQPHQHLLIPTILVISILAKLKMLSHLMHIYGQLLMLSINSYICWSFVFLLWKLSVEAVCPFLRGLVAVLCCWVFELRDIFSMLIFSDR